VGFPEHEIQKLTLFLWRHISWFPRITASDKRFGSVLDGNTDIVYEIEFYQLYHFRSLVLWSYRVSIKPFPDYKYLLQENYVEYKHIFYHYLSCILKFYDMFLL